MDTIHIKNSWKEVTIGEFMAIQELNPEDYDSDLEYYIELLSILSDKDRDYLCNMPLVNIPGLIEPLTFLSTPPRGKLRKSYKINGRKYKACLNVRELTAIQYIDLVALMKNNQNNRNLHLLLSVLLEEEGKKYNTDGFDVQQAAEEIRNHFNIADASAISLFFLMLFTNLIKGIQSFSVSEMKKMLKTETDPEKRQQMTTLIRETMDLIQNGGGFTI